MKQYIKPTTDVQNITVRTEMMEVSRLGSENVQQDNVQGTAKERDVWSDGFWD